jgi:hypothetical protein
VHGGVNEFQACELGSLTVIKVQIRTDRWRKAQNLARIELNDASIQLIRCRGDGSIGSQVIYSKDTIQPSF